MSLHVNKKIIPIIVSGCMFSGVAYSAGESDWAGTSFEVVKTGGESAGKIFAYSSGVRPYSVGAASGPAAAAAAVGSVIAKVTDIIVDKHIDKQCKSQDSHNVNESLCETPPDFIKNMFCIANTDNVNRSAVRIEFDTNHPSPEGLWAFDKDSERELINLKHNEQVCIPKPKRLGIVSVSPLYGQATAHRLMPIDFYSGEYGAIVKNGKLHMKQKRSKTTQNDIPGYKYCKDIMMHYNGLDTDRAIKSCKARLMEQNPSVNPKVFDRIFTKTMESVDYQDINRIVDKPTLQEILRNVAYYKKGGSNKNKIYMSGSFMLDGSHYVYVEETALDVKDGKVIYPTSISLKLIKTKPYNSTFNTNDATGFEGIPITRFSDKDGVLTLKKFIF